MSKIVIEIENYKDLVKTIAKVKDVTKEGVASVKSNITNHKPVYEGKLFYNDHDEISNDLISLVKGLGSIETQIGIYEVDEDENIENFEDFEDSKITPAELLNILQKHDDEIIRQQNL